MLCFWCCTALFFSPHVWEYSNLDSIILGTRKLWWIFPIKQKFDTTAAFLDNSKYSIWSRLTVFSLKTFQRASRLHNGHKTIPNFDSFEYLYCKKSCPGIKFLFNWKNSTQFSGAFNDWIWTPEIHVYLEERSTYIECDALSWHI